jgi:hypothetical protein
MHPYTIHHVGGCVKRLQNILQRRSDDELVCHMRPQLLRAIRDELGLEFAPLFLATDGEVREDQYLLEEHGAIVLDYAQVGSLTRVHASHGSHGKRNMHPSHGIYTSKHTHWQTIGILVDQYLLSRAEVFVGNPSSSLSVNVCRARSGVRCFFISPNYIQGDALHRILPVTEQ